MPDRRKNKPWYKIWKVIFNGYLYLCLFVLAGSVLGVILNGLGQFMIIPFYLAIFTSPLFLVSFIALFTMRENDKEPDKMIERNKTSNKV